MPKTRTPSSSTYLRRRRWTAEDAKQALAALAQSGLELSAFATREGLDAQRLWRWRRQLAAPAAMAFEEIVPRDATPAPDGGATSPSERERFEIVLGSGRVVRVPASFDASALRQLLTIMEEVHRC
jgi:transposase-like protein